MSLDINIFKKSAEKLAEKNLKINSEVKKILNIFLVTVTEEAKTKNISNLGKTTKTKIASRSGLLRASIFSEILDESEEDNLQKILARVGVSSNVVYAAIHEYGGKTGKNGGVTIPKRPYIAPAIRKFLPKLNARLQEVLNG